MAEPGKPAVTFQDRVVGNGLYLMSRITGRTGRYQVEGMEHVAAAQAAANYYERRP